MKNNNKKIKNDKRVENDDEESSFVIMVSMRFLILTTTASILLAFAVGRSARFLLLTTTRGANNNNNNDDDKHWTIVPNMIDDIQKDMANMLGGSNNYFDNNHHNNDKTLPPPVAKDGQPIPRTVYTSKNFDTARSATSSSLLIRRPSPSDNNNNAPCFNSPDCHLQYPAMVPMLEQPSTDDNKEQEHVDVDEEHIPAGQHLLVDIKHVDPTFLNSEQRLAHAMVQVVREANLTLLSYHCHSLLPTGVSCVGVLLESHISLHTWPTHGVITLDLFTCGSNPLLPVLALIQTLFGVAVPTSSNYQEPKMIWAHKLRGFRPIYSRGPLQTWDLGLDTLGVMYMEYKQEVASVETPYQRIDIYDVISRRGQQQQAVHSDNHGPLLSNDNSASSCNDDDEPDRLVFLDGVLQSKASGEHSYHESLVHPAMLAHPHPKRVAIIGGGEGATLRETLKHNTVERVVMIEIDEVMVNVSRQFLPQWSDCSNLVGSADWCANDKRAHIYYEDGIAFFKNKHKQRDELPFDVIIIDALDPEDNVEFSDALYNCGDFLHSLYNALSDDGVLVVQVGESPDSNAPEEYLGLHKNRALLIDHVSSIGFKSIHIYGEGHSGLTNTWNYLVATKSLAARRNWYRNEAEIALDIRRRIVKTKIGKSPLVFFDAATMVSYQLPSKRFENVFCRREPLPPQCEDERGFDPETPNANISMFEVKQSKIGTDAGRGVFAKTDIPEDNYIAIESTIHALHFAPLCFEIIEQLENSEFGDELTPLMYYMHGYGFQMQTKGAREVYVDSGILTFVNHGCNGTYNIGADTGDLHEFSASIDEMPTFLNYRGSSNDTSAVFNPVLDRHLRHQLTGDTTLRSIAAGEEILDNYLDFVGDERDWEYDIRHLRQQCSGAGLGDVTQYEQAQTTMK